MRTDTITLIHAMRILAEQIESEDGVANAAIGEAANRLKELYSVNKDLVEVLELALRSHGVVKPTAKPIECWDYYKVEEKAVEVLQRAAKLL